MSIRISRGEFVVGAVLCLALVSCGGGGSDPDPCDGVTCSFHGTCIVENETARCDCAPGYEEQGLACVEATTDGDADSDSDADTSQDSDVESDADSPVDGEFDSDVEDADADEEHDGAMPEEGLILHYSFDECDGTDSSASGCDATLIGDPPPECVVGVTGNAFHLSGTDSDENRARIALTEPACPLLSGLEGFTIAVWFRADEIPSEPSVLTHTFDVFQQYSLGPTRESGNHLAFRVNIGGGASANIELLSDAPIATDRWYFAAVTYDGSGVRMYVDGVLQADESAATGFVGSHHTYTGGVFIGTENRNPVYTAFQGSVDNVRFYNRALSEAEVAVLLAE